MVFDIVEACAVGCHRDVIVLMDPSSLLVCDEDLSDLLVDTIFHGGLRTDESREAFCEYEGNQDAESEEGQGLKRSFHQ